MRSRLLALAVLAGTAALGAPIHAGVTTPGSLLVFPEFDNRVLNNGARNLTLITVTNTHPTDSIEVHYVYRNSPDCLETNRSHILTANDTLSVLTAVHNPNRDQGYLYVYAQDRITHQPVKFDFLIGTGMNLRGDVDDARDASYEFPPFIFRASARLNTGQQTDFDHDGLRDLNGVEYERTPDVLLVPRFFGQNAPDTNMLLGNQLAFRSELVLINLTGGRLFDAIVDFLIYNDNEDVFSAQHQFRCWERVALADIDGVFTNDFLVNLSTNNPNEVQGGGGNFPETGWFSIDGNSADSTAAHFDDPAILAMRIEIDHSENRCGGAILPFCLGMQDNGDLLSLSLQGDTDDLP